MNIDDDGMLPGVSVEYTTVSSPTPQGPNTAARQNAPRRNAANKPACSRSVPERKITDDQRPMIAVLGDSNTKGYPWETAFKATNSLPFPQLVEQCAQRWIKKYRITVRTFARVGAAIMGSSESKSSTPGFYWCQAFNEFLTLRPRPVVIVVCLGTNDVKIFSRRRADPVPPDDEFRKTVREFFRRLRLMDRDVPLLVVRPLGLVNSEEHARVAGILEAETKELQKVHFLCIDDQHIEYAADRVHLTPRGHVQFTERLMAPLRKLIHRVHRDRAMDGVTQQVDFPTIDLIIPLRQCVSKKQEHVTFVSRSVDDHDANEDRDALLCPMDMSDDTVETVPARRKAHAQSTPEGTVKRPRERTPISRHVDTAGQCVQKKVKTISRQSRKSDRTHAGSSSYAIPPATSAKPVGYTTLGGEATGAGRISRYAGSGRASRGRKKVIRPEGDTAASLRNNIDKGGSSALWEEGGHAKRGHAKRNAAGPSVLISDSADRCKIENAVKCGGAKKERRKTSAVGVKKVDISIGQGTDNVRDEAKKHCRPRVCKDECAPRMTEALVGDAAWIQSRATEAGRDHRDKNERTSGKACAMGDSVRSQSSQRRNKRVRRDIVDAGAADINAIKEETMEPMIGKEEVMVARFAATAARKADETDAAVGKRMQLTL
eukprot:GEMP01011045.1.p1 GENE.GEMP01011045.1~~GEMP01011045.1.p1  ORF type:complete len:659 (+),score=118.19 GEMP01011045.1:157-2133(+)